MSPSGLASGAAAPEKPNDARSLRERLERSFEAPRIAEAARTKRRDALIRRGLKLAAALAAVVVLGWSPMRMLLAPASDEAVVNARLIDIRAPIEGYLSAEPAALKPWSAPGEAPNLEIENPDADRAPLAAASRALGDVEDQLQINASERAATRSALAASQSQMQAFLEARAAALDARIAGLAAEAEAASARAIEADAQWRRSRTLRNAGVTAAATEERQKSEATAAALAAKSAAFKAAEAEIERDALAKGEFVGDDYNDLPNSAAAARELTLKLAALDAQAAALGRAKARLQADFDAETALYARRSRAQLALPAAGRVFEALAGRGERVSKGQTILRVVDCAGVFVSANVQESVYNRLRIGGKATFSPADGGAKVVGEIVNLTGANAAPGDYAISPASLRKSSFYVTVALPGARPDCAIGRTGDLTFAKD